MDEGAADNTTSCVISFTADTEAAEGLPHGGGLSNTDFAAVGDNDTRGAPDGVRVA